MLVRKALLINPFVATLPETVFTMANVLLNCNEPGSVSYNHNGNGPVSALDSNERASSCVICVADADRKPDEPQNSISD